MLSGANIQEVGQWSRRSLVMFFTCLIPSQHVYSCFMLKMNQPILSKVKAKAINLPLASKNWLTTRTTRPLEQICLILALTCNTSQKCASIVLKDKSRMTWQFNNLS